MSTPKLTLLAAEAEAALARERLSNTVLQIQAKLDPASLVEEAREAGLSAVHAGVDHARRNPGIVAGALATVGLLLARNRISAAVRHRRAAKPLPARPRSE